MHEDLKGAKQEISSVDFKMVGVIAERKQLESKIDQLNSDLQKIEGQIEA